MKLALNDSEIKRACTTFLETMGISTKGKEVTVKLIAGRSGKGHTAEVEVVESTENITTPEPVYVSRRNEVLESSIPEVDGIDLDNVLDIKSESELSNNNLDLFEDDDSASESIFNTND